VNQERKTSNREIRGRKEINTKENRKNNKQPQRKCDKI
jgi:hypothetical protein